MSIKEDFEAFVAGASPLPVDDAGAVYESLPVVTEHDPQQLVGRSLNNRYVLESLIGQGTTSWVFKARDIRKVEACSNQPYVAIKVLNLDLRGQPEARVGLEREAARSQQLNHPGIVAVYDFDRDGGLFYLVMEWLNGPTLDSFIQRLSARERRSSRVRDMIGSLISALDYAHQKGIIHSDFKPSNVILDENGQPRILDYGVARMTYAVVQPHGWTSGFQGFTPTYASWKRLKGGHASVEDDTYALACVIYELLTGYHPYGRRPATEARQAGLRLRRPRGLPSQAWKLLKQALDTEGAKVPRLSDLAQAFRGDSAGSRVSPASLVIFALGALITLGLNVAALDRWATAARYQLYPQPEFLEQALERRSAAERELLWQLTGSRVMEELEQLKQQYRRHGDIEPLMAAWSLSMPLLERVSGQPELLEAGRWLEAERIRELYRNYLNLNRFSPRPLAGGLSLESPLASAFRRVQVLDAGHPVLAQGRWHSQLRNELEQTLIQGRWSDAMALTDFAMGLLPGDDFFVQIHQRLMQVGQEADQESWPEPTPLDPAAASRKMIIDLVRSGLIDEARRELRHWLGLAQEVDKATLLDALKSQYDAQMQDLPQALRPEAQSHGLSFFAGLVLDRATVPQAEEELKEAAIGMVQALERNAGVDDAVGKVRQQLDRLTGSTASLQWGSAYLESLLKSQLAWQQKGSPAFARFQKAAETLLPAQDWTPTGETSRISCHDVQANGAQVVSLCRDRIESFLMGPELVLVSDLPRRQAFYLSRKETLVGDYNLYCRLSLDCHPRKGPEDVPLTEISYAEANRYIRWLNETTGQRYRLPRLQEWSLAAEQGQAVLACNTEAGLLAGGQGQGDNLGILHLAGNVRELVLDGRQLRAQGGNAWDAQEKCSVALGAIHHGRPDRLTGFRLVREVR